MSIRNKLADLEDKIDDLIASLRTKMGLNDPMQIVPYRTYGTTNRLYVKGRLLEDKMLKGSSANDSLLSNLLNMYKRFESDEVPGAQIALCHQNKEHLITTDREGYFEINFSPDNAIPLDGCWHKVALEVRQAPIPMPSPVKAEAEVLIPPFDAEYGIISDIDDTIVETSATDLLRMAKTVLVNNAHTRMPFAGVSAFYKSLQVGRNGKRNNPFFYVSSGPWNMYDLLKEYLDLNEIPAGPILLRDFGLNKDKLSGSGGHHQHKLKEIENILLTYPQLDFILIGDSGQEDAAIYREVVKRFPGRILAIYIRDVQSEAREKVVKAIAEELSAEGEVDMLLTATAAEAARHAAQKGLIFDNELQEIEHDKDMDQGIRPGKEEKTL